MTKLEWTNTPSANVARDGSYTFVMTRNRAAGRPNRYDLTVIVDGSDPIVLGREIPPSQCRLLASRFCESSHREQVGIRWPTPHGGYRIFPWCGRWSWHYTEAHDGYESSEAAEKSAREHMGRLGKGKDLVVAFADSFSTFITSLDGYEATREDPDADTNHLVGKLVVEAARKFSPPSLYAANRIASYMRRRSGQLVVDDDNMKPYDDLEAEMSVDVDVSIALRWCADWIENNCEEI